MKPEPSDKDEETRARGLAEQCWLGPLCLVFWVLVIMAAIHGCHAAECTLAWDANNPAEHISEYRLYCGLDLLASVPGTVTTAKVTLPDAACTVAIVAINAVGTSPPATLRLSFLTDQESVDMRAWSILRSYHREFIPGPRFYRAKIETPP